MSSLRWPTASARIVASFVAFAPLYATAVYFYRRRRPEHRPRIVRLAQRAGFRNIVAAYLSLLALWFLVIEFSYVAHVRIPKHVFSRASDANIAVSVELGDAVSDASRARIGLRNISGGQPVSEALRLTPVDRGHYVSLLSTKSLHPGAYEVAMTYPHGALSSSFPFVRKEINRSVGFVLVD